VNVGVVKVIPKARPLQTRNAMFDVSVTNSLFAEEGTELTFTGPPTRLRQPPQPLPVHPPP